MSVVHGRGRLTPVDHINIERFAGEGLNASAIARKIGKHPSTVQWFMYSTGLQAPKQTDTPKSYVRRNGRTVKGFSSHEDAFIQALRIQDYTPIQIAELASKRFDTQRSHHTIRCRLKMLAAAEDAE